MGGSREGTARTRERDIETVGTKLSLCEEGREGNKFQASVFHR